MTRCVFDVPLKPGTPLRSLDDYQRPARPPLAFEYFAPEGEPLAHATASFDGDAIFGGACRICDGAPMVIGDHAGEHPVLAGPDVARCKRCERAVRLCLKVGNMRPAQILAECRARMDPFYYSAAAA